MMWIGMTDRYQGLLAELACRSGTYRSRKETAPAPMEGAAASTSSEREAAGDLTLTERRSPVSVSEAVSKVETTATGLRGVADWLDRHPELLSDERAPWAVVYLRFAHDRSPARETLTAVADALGDQATETLSLGEVQIVGRFAGGVNVRAHAKVADLTEARPEPAYEPILARDDS